MVRKVLVAIAGSILILAGCAQTDSDSSPTADDDTSVGIHLIAPSGWEDATLVTGPSAGLAAERVEMESTAKGEFVAAKPEGDVYFRFENSSGDTLDLGGTMGSYPGDPPEELLTSLDDVWVDEFGLLHASDPSEDNPDELTVLTVNLHTYQERGARAKLDTVAKAINELDADIVTLQEAAQHKDAAPVEEQYGVEIKADNAALLIVDQLQSEYGSEYDYFWDWSHYGWDVWEEGSAILTKDEIVGTGSKFVTKNQEKTFWKSRNIPMARIQTPDHGTINTFSVHMGWWDDDEEPFKYQFDQLLKWSKSMAGEADSSLFGGDFNNPAGTEGYDYIMKASGFVDVYAAVNPTGMTDPTIGGNIDGWEEGDPSGKRIDFILVDAESALEPILAQRTFTESSLGRVSDHNGVYATFTNRSAGPDSASPTPTSP